MTQIALLRGVNVGIARRVDMAKIRAMFETLGFSAVSTYLNSGNVLFESDKDCPTLQTEIVAKFWQEFGFEIPTLVKTAQQMKEIANVIPAHWQNDETQKTDIAYLFD